MRNWVAAGLGLAVAAGCASTPEAAIESDAEAFMWGYTEAWNRHDTQSLAANYWAMTPSVEEEKARLDATFKQMVDQGYARSTIHEIKSCPTGENTAWAGMKFTRFLTDGEVMGPRDRASEYGLTWKDDRGWRITSIGGSDASKPLECPS